MQLMSKIDRISAWVLMVCFILYMVSGLDIQRRFLAPQLSIWLHLRYLFVPAQITFTYHTAFAMHLAIKRWKLWNNLSKTLLALYTAANLALIGVYVSTLY